jgi:hypothetical protein
MEMTTTEKKSVVVRINTKMILCGFLQGGIVFGKDNKKDLIFKNLTRDTFLSFLLLPGVFFNFLI